VRDQTYRLRESCDVKAFRATPIRVGQESFACD
jgi:hypothetical protein